MFSSEILETWEIHSRVVHADEMDALVKQVVRTYRKSLKASFKQTQLQRFYTTSEVHALVGRWTLKQRG